MKIPQTNRTPKKTNSAPIIAVKYRIILIGVFFATVSNQLALACMRRNR